MFVDFGMARQYDGVCYLRFDDTNPEAEKQVRGWVGVGVGWVLDGWVTWLAGRHGACNGGAAWASLLPCPAPPPSPPPPHAPPQQEYIDHIEEIVSWLGWQPWKVTYSSDYFDQLYAFAVQLIKGGHAYVDHQTAEEIKE